MNDTKQASQEVMLSIQGMNCAACATRIEKVLSKEDGVEYIAVSYPMRTAWLHYRKPISPEPYINKIKKLGFHAKLMSSIIGDMQQEKRKLGWRLILSLLLTIPLLLPMLIHLKLFTPLIQGLPPLLLSPFVQLICATIIQFLIATPFYINAFHALREKIANMDVLVVLGTTVAYFYSHYELFQHSINEILTLPIHILEGLYFETTGVVITAVLIGKYIELKTAIKLQLMNETYIKDEKQEATIIKEGQTLKTNIYSIVAGDRVLVSEGEAIAVDGIIELGSGYVEESFLSGESGWIEKQKSDKVWAGSTLCSGELVIVAEQTAHETRLSTIKKLIKLGQAQKSRIQRQVDQITQWFVPSIILLAFISLLITLFISNSEQHVLPFISVLLVACPCALGLATPISMSVASSAFLKQGLIVKDGTAIERLAKVNQFVFDKTGTLTKGDMKVSFFHSWKGSRVQQIKQLSALEQPLNHPIADAIRRYSKLHIDQLPKVSLWQHYVGMGVGGYIDKKHVVAGNERLLHHLDLQLSFIAKRIAEERYELGETLIFMYEERQLIAIIGLTDKVEENIKEAIYELERLNIQTIMATGDHPKSAHNVARKIGIKKIYSKLLPEQKLQLISQLKQHKTVAMVGDGVNDAPALASSDVGIAMSSGSKEAVETGHMTLLYTDLKALPQAVKVSRLTLVNIRQNLMFAFIYNIVMLPLAMTGLLQPWMAGVAMACSSVCVVGNAFRLHVKLSKYSRLTT